MKHTLYFILIVLVAANLGVKAQTTNGKATGVQIGQQVPDITINNIINYKDKDGKPATTAKISDFKGKLLILDFWATWCAPCIAMIPKMDTLQKKFAGNVQFLPVTYQNKNGVLPFLERLNKRNSKFDASKPPNAMVFSDDVLNSLFPHRLLPHFVWIGTDGIVKAITGYEEVSAKNIEDLLQKRVKNVAIKIDAPITPYDKHKPFLINGNGGNGDNLLFHSALTGYIPGLSGGYDKILGADTITYDKIVLRNVPLPWIYSCAYGNGAIIEDSRIKIDVAHPEKLIYKKEYGISDEAWAKQGNVFSYELILPTSLKPKTYEIMQMDMNRLFAQYKVGFEKQKKKCLVLVRTSKDNKFYAASAEHVLQYDATGANLKGVDMVVFFRILRFYFQSSDAPFLNETGYEGRIDLKINGSLTSISEINKELKKYDLEFIEAERTVDMLVIRDSGLPAVF